MTRWPRRQRADFSDAVTSHTDSQDAAVDAAVPSLAKKLEQLHAKVVTSFFDRVGTTKAGEVREVDIDHAWWKAQLLAAIADLDMTPFAYALYDKSTVLVEAGWENAKALLDVSTGFDVVPERTLAKIRAGINELAMMVQQREQESLRTILSDAFHEGQSGPEVAKTIRAAFADGYHRINAEGKVVLVAATPAWSETVARTEMATAATAGALDLYHEAGIATLRWQASDPCDECAEYDDKVYPIDDLPDEPPVHPNCRCALIPADEDLGSWRGTDEERAAARRGNNDE